MKRLLVLFFVLCGMRALAQDQVIYNKDYSISSLKAVTTSFETTVQSIYQGQEQVWFIPRGVDQDLYLNNGYVVRVRDDFNIVSVSQVSAWQDLSDSLYLSDDPIEDY